MKTSEEQSVDYWKQLASDAITARDSMQERQRATVAECERLRSERDKAVRDMGRFQEQIRLAPPSLTDLIDRAASGDFILTLSFRFEKSEK